MFDTPEPNNVFHLDNHPHPFLAPFHTHTQQPTNQNRQARNYAQAVLNNKKKRKK